MEPSHQACPICGALIPASPRYPRRVCGECLRDGVEVDGLRIDVANLDVYRNARVECSVKGHRCEAREGHIGGIFVQVI